MSDGPASGPAFGSFSVDGGPRRLGFRDGDHVVDLGSVVRAGLLPSELSRVLDTGNLDPLLQAGPTTWSVVFAALDQLPAGPVDDDEHRHRGDSVTMHLPFTVGDYVDFYSSIEHATNLGRILRPHSEPLLPNWRHLPVGYHGRSSTIVPTGTDIVRPSGQVLPHDADQPMFAPTAMLDFELEVGFVTGDGPGLGQPVDVARAESHIFGVFLVNDWSARDIQSWEYQPLGPLLGKSFATSISPWVVPLASLGGFRVDGPFQHPLPLRHLRAPEPRGLDLHLEVSLRTASMLAAGDEPVVVSSTEFAGMYWSMSQQVAHLTSNGAVLRAGDLCASGTVSGPTPGTEGSLMELTWRGTRPLRLPSGDERAFLLDGDEVTMRGWCGSGASRVDLGSVVGRIVGAPT